VAKSLFCTKRILIFVTPAGQSAHEEHIRSQVSMQGCDNSAETPRLSERHNIDILQEDSKISVLARRCGTVHSRQPPRY
jgi:hypothetical protein